MTTSTVKSNLGIIVVVWSVWGLTEFAAGIGLQKCAALFTGAILTGMAFFRVSFIWSITRKLLPVKNQFSTRLINRILLGAGAAIIVTAMFPLGYLTAGWYTVKIREENRIQTSLLSRLWSPAVLICSILIITLVRII